MLVVLREQAMKDLKLMLALQLLFLHQNVKDNRLLRCLLWSSSLIIG